MIRKRFPPARRWRIAAWTTVAVTWVTAIVARTLGTPVAAPAVEAIPPPPPAPTATTVTATTPAPLPEMPEDGLVVLRYTAVPPPPPEVRRVVVSSPAPGPAATAAPAPTTKVSSGS